MAQMGTRAEIQVSRRNAVLPPPPPVEASRAMQLCLVASVQRCAVCPWGRKTGSGMPSRVAQLLAVELGRVWPSWSTVTWAARRGSVLFIQTAGLALVVAWAEQDRPTEELVMGGRFVLVMAFLAFGDWSARAAPVRWPPCACPSDWCLAPEERGARGRHCFRPPTQCADLRLTEWHDDDEGLDSWSGDTVWKQFRAKALVRQQV